MPIPTQWPRPLRRLLPVAAVVLAALALLPAYVRAVTLSGASDAPTLLFGDRAWVNLAGYDVRFPYTGLVLFAGAEPRRGDLVQIIEPERGEPIIKRVVGTPGDRVTMFAHHLRINAQALAYRPYDARVSASVARANHLGSVIEAETLDGVTHLIAYDPGSATSAFEEVVVPKGHYFLLGDNRDNSRDSRVWGPLGRDFIRGKVFRTSLRGEAYSREPEKTSAAVFAPWRSRSCRLHPTIPCPIT